MADTGRNAAPGAGTVDDGVDRSPRAGSTTPLRPKYPVRDDDAQRLLSRFRVLLITGDAAVISLAVGIAVSLRFDGDAAQWYRLAPVVGIVLWLGLLGLNRAYETRFMASGAQEMERVIRSGLGLFTVVAVASYLFSSSISRSIVLLAVPSAVVGSLIIRRVMMHRLHQKRRAGTGVHRTVIVGRHDAATELTRLLNAATYRGLKPVALCVPRLPGLSLSEVDGVPVLGTPEAVLEVVDRTGAHTVAVVSHPDLAGKDLQRLSWALEERGVDLMVSPGIIEVGGPRLSIRPVAGLSMLHLEKPSAHGGKMLLKAAIDRTAGILLLLLASPGLLAVALAVKFDSRGPVFFRQTRVGVDGREFRMIKFRSMVPDAERRLAEVAHLDEGNGVLFKSASDPRITRVGAWLRRLSIDELPQLINVAVGEMSLVGPRPPLPSEVANYNSDAIRRLRVRPGMTGLWQISGRSDLSWQESLRLDLRYVDNWTIGMDLIILWRTVRAVALGSGAY